MRRFPILRVMVMVFVGAMFSMLFSLAYAGANHALSQYELPLSAPKILGLTLQKSTFKDAEKLLGKTPRFRASREAEASDEICYESSGGTSTAKLILESNYTGGWKYLSGFVLTMLAVAPGHKCAKTNEFSYGTKILHGHLWLGMTKQVVVQMMGEPRIRDLGDWGKKGMPKVKTEHNWFYIVTWKKPLTKSLPANTQQQNNAPATQYFDAWIQVKLTFDGGKVVQLRVVHGVSD